MILYKKSYTKSLARRHIVAATAQSP